MKKIIFVYGTISGLVMGVMFFVTAPFWKNGTINFDNGMLVGYTTMVIALSLIFFGIKSYRDQHKNGVISFGLAFRVGILITLVGSVLYALSWELAYNTVSKGFTEQMTAHYVENLKRTAKTQAETDEAIKSIRANMEMYKNPLVRFPMSMMEVFPVGLIITVVSAGLLRRKEFLQAQNS
jgi:hypothetical protein